MFPLSTPTVAREFRPKHLKTNIIVIIMVIIIIIIERSAIV